MRERGAAKVTGGVRNVDVKIGCLGFIYLLAIFNPLKPSVYISGGVRNVDVRDWLSWFHLFAGNF
jgi:hypothetical protein